MTHASAAAADRRLLATKGLSRSGIVRRFARRPAKATCFLTRSEELGADSFQAGVGWRSRSISSPGHRPLRTGPSDTGDSWVGGPCVARLEIGVQLPDRGEHVAERHGTVVPGAIDVEGRSAADAAGETTLLIFFDATSILMTGQRPAYAVRF